MYLKVPYIRQPEDSMWCGVASTTMILKYYGAKITQPRVAKELPPTKNGLTVRRIGTYFLNKGFKVTVQFWIPELEPEARGEIGGAENSKMIASLKRTANKYAGTTTESFCGGMIVLAKKGGVIKLEPPFRPDIEREVRARRPVILNVDSRWLRGEGRT